MRVLAVSYERYSICAGVHIYFLSRNLSRENDTDKAFRGGTIVPLTAHLLRLMVQVNVQMLQNAQESDDWEIENCKVQKQVEDFGETER